MSSEFEIVNHVRDIIKNLRGATSEMERNIVKNTNEITKLFEDIRKRTRSNTNDTIIKIKAKQLVRIKRQNERYTKMISNMKAIEQILNQLNIDFRAKSKEEKKAIDEEFKKQKNPPPPPTKSMFSWLSSSATRKNNKPVANSIKQFLKSIPKLENIMKQNNTKNTEITNANVKEELNAFMREVEALKKTTTPAQVDQSIQQAKTNSSILEILSKSTNTETNTGTKKGGKRNLTRRRH